MIPQIYCILPGRLYKPPQICCFHWCAGDRGTGIFFKSSQGDSTAAKSVTHLLTLQVKVLPTTCSHSPLSIGITCRRHADAQAPPQSLWSDSLGRSCRSVNAPYVTLTHTGVASQWWGRTRITITTDRWKLSRTFKMSSVPGDLRHNKIQIHQLYKALFSASKCPATPYNWYRNQSIHQKMKLLRRIYAMT